MKAKQKEYSTMDIPTLRKELEALMKAQFSLRMQKSHQQLTNTAQLRETRRDIARVRTVLAQKAAANE